eukprot:COSAG06_NODE_8164_length_2254_cov_4.964733_2_plen_59_part_00
MTWALAEGREKALVIASSTADSKLVAANGDFQAAAMHALEPRSRRPGLQQRARPPSPP